LEHLLKDLPLMSSVKRLYNAVLGKIPLKPRDEILVQAFHELGAQADRKVLLVCEGSGRAHQLLKIRLDQTSNLIALVVNVDLTNVVQGRMRLIAIPWAQLQEESVANGG
jgi:hypothetical protein